MAHTCKHNGNWINDSVRTPKKTVTNTLSLYFSYLGADSGARGADEVTFDDIWDISINK